MLFVPVSVCKCVLQIDTKFEAEQAALQLIIMGRSNLCGRGGGRSKVKCRKQRKES